MIVGSICGGHTATCLHPRTCWSLSVHNSSAIVSASCMRSGACPGRDLCLAHSGCVASPSLPPGDESFRALIKTQITLRLMNTIGVREIKSVFVFRLTTSWLPCFLPTFTVADWLEAEDFLRLCLWHVSFFFCFSVVSKAFQSCLRLGLLHAEIDHSVLKICLSKLLLLLLFSCHYYGHPAIMIIHQTSPLADLRFLTRILLLLWVILAIHIFIKTHYSVRDRWKISSQLKQLRLLVHTLNWWKTLHLQVGIMVSVFPTIHECSIFERAVPSKVFF